MKMQYTCTNSIFIFINITAESLNFVGGGGNFRGLLNWFMWT